MEGNFPFLLPEIVHLIGIKAMYLTDDAVRLKRKWKRDMDYRKKHELCYYLNRYLKGKILNGRVGVYSSNGNLRPDR